MPRGLGKILRRVRALAAEQQVRFTLKAFRELAALGLGAMDACETLEGLKTVDFRQETRVRRDRRVDVRVQAARRRHLDLPEADPPGRLRGRIVPRGRGRT